MIQGIGEATADLFKGVSLAMLLNMSFFTAFKAFSICGLSSLFVSS